MAGSDKINSLRNNEGMSRAHGVAAAAGRQGCSVVLSGCCLRYVTRESRKIKQKKKSFFCIKYVKLTSMDGNVRPASYVNLCSYGHYSSAQSCMIDERTAAAKAERCLAAA